MKPIARRTSPYAAINFTRVGADTNSMTGDSLQQFEPVTPIAKRRVRMPRSANESGIVMVVMALTFPLLIMCVAFVVDVSMFFFKSVQVQRTADAAALAGVTRMPRTEDAKKLAVEIALKNGYKNGVNKVTVTVAPPPDTNKRLRVTIVDDSTPLFFGTTVLKNWKIQKTSTAEYVSNIPLGSKENAIGTGDLSDTGVGQGFWLAISGPCAPKEAGDQIASRYDGTGVRRGRFDTDTDTTRNGAMICDYDKNAADPTVNKPAPLEEQASYLQRLRDQIAAARDARNGLSAGHFPALSLNRDWDAEGYNYIVDVPCKNSVDPTSPPPPPCEGSDQQFATDASTSGKDLVIQVYDPVFNPKSVESWLADRTATAANPDLYGIPPDIPAPTTLCVAATPTGCILNTGTANPRPDTVRVTTRFSVYGPDLTPLDYSDDEPVKFSSNDYGSCVKTLDTPPTYAGTVDSQDVNPSPDCATAAGQWVTIARIPQSHVLAQRGRFRINVRTLTTPDSFGTNSFAIRSFFDVPASSNWLACSAVPLLACASVSGDSSMSVFATAPAIKEFYLAKLAPAAIYRGKTVMVRLWDAGEGGSSLQVLRPKATGEDCAYATWVNPDTNPLASTDFCTQKIRWTIGQTGINNYADPTKALKDTGKALSDVCDNKGQDDVFSLPIAGDRNGIETNNASPPAICATTVPQEIYDSRNGPYDTERGKFNDRMVNIKVEVPAAYGCEPVAFAATGACTDIALPQQGWWKIKYIPLSISPGVYRPMTDRSTWTVELLGEPVHLVLDE